MTSHDISKSHISDSVGPTPTKFGVKVICLTDQMILHCNPVTFHATSIKLIYFHFCWHYKDQGWSGDISTYASMIKVDYVKS